MSVHPGSIWIDSHARNIPRDLWIAVDATRIIAESQNYDDLINILFAKNISLPLVTIAFFPSGALQ